MFRRVLFIAACGLVTLSLCISAFAILVPPGRFFSIRAGRFKVGLDCFTVGFFWLSRMRVTIPLIYIAVGIGIPASIYFGIAIGGRLRKRKDGRGFPMEES